MSNERLFLELSSPMAARRLRIFRALDAGMTLQPKHVMDRFGVSRATARRDVVAVRRVLMKLGDTHVGIGVNA